MLRWILVFNPAAEAEESAFHLVAAESVMDGFQEVYQQEGELGEEAAQHWREGAVLWDIGEVNSLVMPGVLLSLTKGALSFFNEELLLACSKVRPVFT